MEYTIINLQTTPLRNGIQDASKSALHPKISNSFSEFRCDKINMVQIIVKNISS